VSGGFPEGRAAWLGLGSNLGPRWRHLAQAIAGLAARDPALVCSSVWKTAPVGGPDGQGPYLNAVARICWREPVPALLGLAHELERRAGRVRAERWGPRTLDVDVLFVEGFASEDPELTVPHPRALERAFVLAPLEEISPELAPANWRGRIDARDAALRRVGAILFHRRPPVAAAGG
jgi:2-amino-4-hydroxy-6-hydroxymethyldihydropteridine diphosphokinase